MTRSLRSLHFALLLTLSALARAAETDTQFQIDEADYAPLDAPSKKCVGGQGFWIKKDNGRIFTIEGQISFFVPTAANYRFSAATTEGCSETEAFKFGPEKVERVLTETCNTKPARVIDRSSLSASHGVVTFTQESLNEPATRGGKAPKQWICRLKRQ